MIQWNKTLYSNCELDWPLQICAFANICGLTSSVIWFLVLLPQLYRNFRRRTVEGLSFGWAFANFTAALNNAFFVFKWGTLPVFAKISAIYMPILEGIIIVQFWIFTPFNVQKLVLACFCILIWTAIILLQVFLSVYDWMQWISVVLWSVESFPQIFMNMKRRSTKGLSFIMIMLTAIGKTTDFCSNYLLIMPMQNVVMCYFSSSVAYIVTLQVILYWKQLPLKNNDTPDFENGNKTETTEQAVITVPKISKSCNVVRLCFTIYFATLLLCFAVGIIWRIGTFIAVTAPIGIVIILTTAYVYYYTSFGRAMKSKMDHYFAVSKK